MPRAVTFERQRRPSPIRPGPHIQGYIKSPYPRDEISQLKSELPAPKVNKELIYEFRGPPSVPELDRQLFNIILANFPDATVRSKWTSSYLDITGQSEQNSPYLSSSVRRLLKIHHLSIEFLHRGPDIDKLDDVARALRKNILPKDGMLEAAVEFVFPSEHRTVTAWYPPKIDPVALEAFLKDYDFDDLSEVEDK
ncbi:hypothetical protein NUW58_g7559 [Xylaria curta]|uniref:Uncharacterized protein n=1 Tax=Xylaria curta TaxID=42375 RepID=A0ACC1NGY5_9PEZI|nr:hypothetical protein NUW58_g7559 [Xylaria curta]